MVEKLQGSIQVTSELGEGSAFKFFIKTTVAKAPILDTSRESAPQPPAKEIVSSAQSTRGMILIVEDNPVNAKVLDRQLRRHNYSTEIAVNGLEALNAIKRRNTPYDCILMDLSMPVMDGYEAVSHIRAMEASGELTFRSVVIAITGNAREEQQTNARAAGMDHVMIKPYQFNDVLRQIEHRRLASP